MMKKEKVDRIERVFRETFLADSAVPAVSPQWHGGCFRAERRSVLAFAAAGAYSVAERLGRTGGGDSDFHYVFHI